MKKSDVIRDWMLERPSLSIRGLEKEADLPARTLNHVIHGERSLTEDHILRLLPVISRYGFDRRVIDTEGN